MPNLLYNAVLCSIIVTASSAYSASAVSQAKVYDNPLDCVVYPSATAELSSSVSGVIGSINVERSQIVKQHQIVAMLESGAEQASLDIMQARVDSDLEIDFRRESSALAQRQHTRVSLLSDEQVLSEEDYDTRKTDASLGKIQLAQAEERKRFLKLELNKTKELLERRVVRSPFSGVITERHKEVGEFVEGDSIATLVQLDPLYIETIVSSIYLGDIQPGMSARVSQSTEDSEYHMAVVERVDKVVDVASDTFGVRLSLPNPDYKLTAGLRCRIQFVSADIDLAAATPVREQEQAKDYASPESLAKISGAESNATTELSKVKNEANDTAQEYKVEDAQSICEWGLRYNTAEEAKRVSNRYKQQGISVQVASLPGSKERGHLVMSLPLESEDDSAKWIKEFKTRDFSEYRIIENNPGKDRISLGAFESGERALKRLESVLRMGLKSEIIPWKEKLDYFVVVPSDAADVRNVHCL